MSSSDIAISVRDLAKSYTISHNMARPETVREALKHTIKNSFQRVEKETFWALKDLSFDIKQGDVVGIIGRNGAGKSTLLKILSRITEPTTGRIELYGRIGSLLEVGTGFHPELTGRENIYLNGAILGMTKREIDRQFDAIVDFAGVEKFLDTPVKRYSSGMYVRLAFAVAAHLEPEILIVDEVLAVGDAAFQKKCLGKMQDVANQGRTVLFVSHNVGAVATLCTQALFLENGRCIAQGDTTLIVSRYLSSGKAMTGELILDEDIVSGQRLKITKISVLNGSGYPSGEFELDEDVVVEIGFRVAVPGVGYNIEIHVHNMEHGCIFTTGLMDKDPDNLRNKHWEPGSYKAKFRLPTKMMRGGEYWLKASSAIPLVEALHIVDQELPFSLVDISSPEAKMPQNRSGVLLPIIPWSVSEASSELCHRVHVVPSRT